MMKKLVVVIFAVVLFSSAAEAEEIVRDILWDQVRESGELSGGEVVTSQGTDKAKVLKVDGEPGMPTKIGVLTLKHPGVTKPVYAIRGNISYKNVSGQGYLELMNFFPGDLHFFTKTLAPQGPLASLKGNSQWRPFLLPFFANSGDTLRGKAALPETLLLSVVLPQGGTVYLSSLQVVQYNSNEDPFLAFSKHVATKSGYWFSDRTGGLFGGIFGAVVGCLGGLIGTLVSMGKAKDFVLGLMRFLILLGGATLVAGVVGIAQSQPYFVYFPLLLVGGITVLVFAGVLPTARKRYEEAELRKMHAMDGA